MEPTAIRLPALIIEFCSTLFWLEGYRFRRLDRCIARLHRYRLPFAFFFLPNFPNRLPNLCNYCCVFDLLVPVYVLAYLYVCKCGCMCACVFIQVRLILKTANSTFYPWSLRMEDIWEKLNLHVRKRLSAVAGSPWNASPGLSKCCFWIAFSISVWLKLGIVMILQALRNKLTYFLLHKAL